MQLQRARGQPSAAEQRAVPERQSAMAPRRRRFADDVILERERCAGRLAAHEAKLYTAGISGEDRHTAADRKSTRLNSSHSQISYAVFCLKKKKNKTNNTNKKN